MAQYLKSHLGQKASGYHFPQKGIGRLKRSSLRAKEHKSIFKDWISYSASRPRVSRFEHNPNLFFLIQVQDDEGDHVLVAGGLYMPSSKQTRAIRKCIAENSTPFDRLFAAKSFSSHFPGGFSEERISSRSPRGFDPEHPRINWLKLQAFFVWRSYTLREFSSSTFAERVAEDFTQIIKLNELLDLAILDRWPSRKGKIQNQRSVISALDDIEAPRQKMDF